VRGRIVFALFLIVQITDGWLTYQGIERFGSAVEANPIVAWYVLAFGPGTALVGAKSMAATCGVALYLRAMYGTMAFLTAFYVLAAVVPWMHVL
jgi:hypothetical protein